MPRKSRNLEAPQESKAERLTVIDERGSLCVVRAAKNGAHFTGRANKSAGLHCLQI